MEPEKRNASTEIVFTEDLFESEEFFQALTEMQERLEIKKREFQNDEDKAKVYASQLVVR